jgi:hypothetical protein
MFFMKNRYSLLGAAIQLISAFSGCTQKPAGRPGVVSGSHSNNQEIKYVNRFENENHPEIGYWFISPNLISDEKKILANIDSIADKCMYTMLFLTSREGANFYDFPVMHPVFQKLVAEGHRKGLKVGLQLWGNYKDTQMEGSQRMIIENEVSLDEKGNADYTAKAKFIRFPDRLLKSDLIKVYAFRKTSDGFYDPATVKDITSFCKAVLPDKETVQIKIRGGESVKGLTACVMTQQYCSQSSMWGDVEINGFSEAMKIYSDIPFDGFALDEYGNKFVARETELGPGQAFRGRWYSNAMADEYLQMKGIPLEKTLFDARYAPEGKPEVRMKAINEYMEFMRMGALRVEKEVYKRSKEIFGKNIFNGIHNTYHNSLINDEIWANGIGWWDAPREYGQTDEKTPTPIQMGVAMAHPMNAMYNQYYDKDLEPVLVKAFSDLRFGIRTHYHALNDHRPLRFDLEDADAVTGINQIETCTRLLNKFNPSLPDIKLLVIFGMEALSNWFPDEAERGIYDINDKLGIEAKGVEIWNAAGYLNAIVPSDLIVNKKLTLSPDGKPVLNGHTFDAVVYLNPQYAREPVLKFLEEYENKGGKLMLEGTAKNDFKGNDISKRFNSISKKATVIGYSVENLSKLGIRKNLLPDGCKNEDGSYVFTDRSSLLTSAMASFTVNLDGDEYSGEYKGLAIISANKTNGLKEFAAHGFTELKRNGKVILSFKNPVDIYISKLNGKTEIVLADVSKNIRPTVNEL